jgi:hypothetical protein
MSSRSSRRVRANRRESFSVPIEHLESRQLLSAVPAAVKPIATVLHRAVIQETEGAAFTGAGVATLTADPAGTYTASINWGDRSSPSTGTVVGDGSGNFTVIGNHYYFKSGIYPVTVKVTDQNNKVKTVASTAKVADAPLAASPILISAVRNTAFSGNVATFTDADPHGLFSRKTELINWGDGTSSAGTISEANWGGPFTVSGKHIFAVAKTYTVVITIRDMQGGAKATATSSAVVSPPAPVTTPSLIGDFKGKVKIGGIVGFFTGSQSFELNMTAQDLNGITGQIMVAGDEIASGTFPAGGVGELSNGNFEYMQSDSGVAVTISGHISPDGKTITSGFISGSGLPFVGSLHGTFTLTRVS